MPAKTERLRLHITGKTAAEVRGFSRSLGKPTNETVSYLLTFGVRFFRYVELIPSSQSKHSKAREQADYDAVRGVIAEVRAVKGEFVNEVRCDDIELDIEISTELFKALCRVELRPLETAAAYLIGVAIEKIKFALERR